MPQLGETVAEGKISAWFRSVGDAVNAGDNLFEVETDKTAMEVPTLVSGVVAEIRVSAGETVPVGTVVAVIANAGAAAVRPASKSKVEPPKAAKPPAARLSPSAAPPTAAPSPAHARLPYDPFREVRAPERNYGPARLQNGIPTTPLARRRAAETGIDLRAVRGSGPHGRVVVRDVEQSKPDARSVPALNARLAGMFDPTSFEMVPHDSRRRIGAEEVVAAKRSIPHFYLRREVSLTALLALVEKVKEFERASRITLTDCIVKSLAVALTRVPQANVRWGDDEMLRFREVDIAVRTGTGGARIIRAANGKSLAAIAGEMAAVAHPGAQADHAVSAVWDMSESGIAATAAIIRPPEVTALSIGSIEQRATARNGQISAESRSTLTLCCDHRAIDGVTGTRLISACADVIERPMMLIL